MEDEGSIPNVANAYGEDVGKPMNGQSIERPFDDCLGASRTMRRTPSAPKPHTAASRLACSSVDAASRLHPRDNSLASSSADGQKCAAPSEPSLAAVTIDTVSSPASTTAFSSLSMALTPIAASGVGTTAPSPSFSFSTEAKKDLGLSTMAKGWNCRTKTTSSLATESDYSVSSLQTLGSQTLVLQQRETRRLERILEREEQCVAELARSKEEAYALSRALDEERTMHSEIVAEYEVKLHNLEACLAKEKEKGTAIVTQLVDRVGTAESERDEALGLLDEALDSLRKEQSAAAEIADELTLAKEAAAQEEAGFDLCRAACVLTDGLDRQPERKKQTIIEHSQRRSTADAELAELLSKAETERDRVQKELENERSVSSEIAASLDEAKRNAEEMKVRFEEQINRLAGHLGELINMEVPDAGDDNGDCAEVQPNPSTDDDSPIDEMDEHVLACLVKNP